MTAETEPREHKVKFPWDSRISHNYSKLEHVALPQELQKKEPKKIKFQF